MLYQLLVIVVLAIAVLRGAKKGIIGQIDSLLGLGFGITACRLLKGKVAYEIVTLWPATTNTPDTMFLPEALACAFLFMLFYALMASLRPLLRRIFCKLEVGVGNVMLGVVLSVIKYIVMLSLIYNIVIGLNPNSSLMKDACSDDGNLCEGVLMVAPALMNTHNFENLAHEKQMLEASKISCNQRGEMCVENYNI